MQQRLGVAAGRRAALARLALLPRLAAMWAGDLWWHAARAAPQDEVETLPVAFPPERFAGGAEAAAERFAAAYPELLLKADGPVLIWPDGQRMAVDDGRPKSFAAALRDPDLQDQLSMPYPKGPLAEAVPQTDPGRVRYEPFFTKAYGGSLAQVQRSLVAVPWLPRHGRTTLWVTRVNGVALRLARVSAELQELPLELQPFIAKPGGAFYWRHVAGTSRLSAHSFGIAVDIDPRHGDYWRWGRRPGEPLVYRNRIPPSIVEAFEREGFIWGGKWYHFDTMHFEYRPELLPHS